MPVATATASRRVRRRLPDCGLADALGDVAKGKPRRHNQLLNRNCAWVERSRNGYHAARQAPGGLFRRLASLTREKRIRRLLMPFVRDGLAANGCGEPPPITGNGALGDFVRGAGQLRPREDQSGIVVYVEALSHPEAPGEAAAPSRAGAVRSNQAGLVAIPQGLQFRILPTSRLEPILQILRKIGIVAIGLCGIEVERFSGLADGALQIRGRSTLTNGLDSCAHLLWRVPVAVCVHDAGGAADAPSLALLGCREVHRSREAHQTVDVLDLIAIEPSRDAAPLRLCPFAMSLRVQLLLQVPEELNSSAAVHDYRRRKLAPADLLQQTWSAPPVPRVNWHLARPRRQEWPGSRRCRLSPASYAERQLSAHSRCSTGSWTR